MDKKLVNAELNSYSRAELATLPAVAHLLASARKFFVTAVPLEYQDDSDADTWSLSVVWRGENSWAVTDHSRQLGRNGKWEYERLPSARTNKFIENYRFDLPTALALAQEAAKKVVINGLSVESFVKLVTATRRAQAELPDHDVNSPEVRARFHEVLRSMNPDSALERFLRD